MGTAILRPVQEWNPEEIILEDAALEVAKSTCNHLVIAGPGAGKTELLAQRACFLLETNSCPYPKRILAVSFKKDSATNLEERVVKRCGKELAYRLDSYTFDRFCKEILDRFRLALPTIYQPDKDYRVDQDNKLLKQAYELSGYSAPYISPKEIQPNHPKAVLDILLHGKATSDFPPALNFNLIDRLALYILEQNSLITSSLRKTYSHVFLDEFQDTTALQYKLIKTCFYESSAIITAVGDQKQRIMLWAGAMPNVFEIFEQDFRAISKTMIMNHRSAPQLLHLQKSLYSALNEKEIEITPDSKWNPDDGQATIAVFDNEVLEREYIVGAIKTQLSCGTPPHDICILVKRSISEYLGDLLEREIYPGIRIRNEITYQDLLKEDAVQIILASLYCAMSSANPDAFMYLHGIDLQIKNIDVDDVEKVNANYTVLDGFISLLRNNLEKLKAEAPMDSVYMTLNSVFDYIGEKAYRDAYPQYQYGDFFDTTREKAIQLLWSEFIKTGNWMLSLKNFEGENSIPAMTIHKSKGLEFDTVFVVGVEDAAFFADNRPLQAEDISAFFVSASRAKRNLYITTSRSRDGVLRGGGVQQYSNVKVLYNALKESGYVNIENLAKKES